MINFEAARVNMVDGQIRTTDVTSHSVLSAFLTVPREAFLPEALKPLAYIDEDLQIAPGRYLMDPSPLAKMLQLVEISKTDRVLEVGAGTGYVAALLADLAGSVTALEQDDDLASQARSTLEALGVETVSVVHGPLEAGHAANAPYDLIFVSGAVEVVPDALLAQIKDGGRLVAVVGHGQVARATLFVKTGTAVSSTAFFNASIKPLPGFRKHQDFVF